MQKYLLSTLLLTAVSGFSQLNLGIISQKIGSAQDQPANSIVKNGNYIYVSSKFSNSYLKTFDVSGNTLSQMTDSVAYLSAGTKDIQKMIIDGSSLYTAGAKGMMVLNLSNPQVPSQVAHVTSVMDGVTSRNINSSAIAKLNNYVLVESGWSGCMLLDVTSPGSPVFKSLIAYTGVMTDVTFINSTTAALVDGYNLYFLNLTNPNSMTKTTVYVTGDPKGMLYDASKNVLYVTSETVSKSYLFSYNTVSKTKLDSIELTSASMYLKDMSLKNPDTLLIGGDTQDIIGVKVSNTSALQAIGNYSNNLYGGAKDAILCSGDYVYAASYDDVLIYKWGAVNGMNETVRGIENVKVFPNPANDQLNILFGNSETNSLAISDIQGKMIMTFNVADTENIAVNISGLEKGIYFLKLISDDKVVVKKFIKE